MNPMELDKDNSGDIATARRLLGPQCRTHSAPELRTVGSQLAWLCPDCGALISSRDVTGEEYPKTLARKRQERREQLVAESVETLKHDDYIPSTQGGYVILREDLEAAARRYHHLHDIAIALDVHSSSVTRAAKRYGIPLPE